MPWIIFLLSATAIIVAGTKLSQYGDQIAEYSGLGRLWIGVVLMAGATSLPEILTDINAAFLDAPDLAVGDLFGSNMANMCILGIIDLLHRQKRVWRCAKPTGEFTRTDPVFAVYQEPDGGDPLVQPEERVFHYGPSFNGKLLLEVSDPTFPHSCFSEKSDFVGTAPGTDNSIWPTQRYHELQTNIRILKVADGFNQCLGEILSAHAEQFNTSLGLLSI